MIPIHKNGERKIPSNYRGITLLPVISKVFTRIIRNRIEMWAEDNSKLNDSQFGFRENRTIDAIYVLFNTLQVYKKGTNWFLHVLWTLLKHSIQSTIYYYGKSYLTWV